jgi:hypothetical protein
MKRLVVNAFCPAKHKVITRDMANTDLPPGGIEIHFRRHGPIHVL